MSYPISVFVVHPLRTLVLTTLFRVKHHFLCFDHKKEQSSCVDDPCKRSFLHNLPSSLFSSLPWYAWSCTSLVVSFPTSLHAFLERDGILKLPMHCVWANFIERDPCHIRWDPLCLFVQTSHSRYPNVISYTVLLFFKVIPLCLFWDIQCFQNVVFQRLSHCIPQTFVVFLWRRHPLVRSTVFFLYRYVALSTSYRFRILYPIHLSSFPSFDSIGSCFQADCKGKSRD